MSCTSRTVSGVGEGCWDGHDPKNVRYDAPEFDQALGVDWLHRVRPQVRFKPRRTILPPDVFAKYQEMTLLSDRAGTAASVVTASRKNGVADTGSG